MLNNYLFSVGKFSTEFCVLDLTGSDTESFLQKQSTFNITELKVGEFHLASFLDTHGRLECYTWICQLETSFKLLIPTLLKKQALERLERYLISEDVTIVEQGPQRWTIVLGPKALAYKTLNSFSGHFLEEKALLIPGEHDEQIPLISEDEWLLWQSLNGWPDLQGHNFKSELINNTRLYELSLSHKKGCYPGQETVSKIAVNRGAAYAPVLLEAHTNLNQGDLFVLDKKIGEIEFSKVVDGRFVMGARILRDFRVSNLNLEVTQNSQNIQLKVRYYPFYSGSIEQKSRELFYQGAEAFKQDKIDLAEKYFRQAISLDPKCSDAFESLGVMLGRQERFNEAIELMDQLSQIDPSSVLAHTNKSLYLMRLGRIEEAEQEKALATVKSFQKFGEEAKLKEKLEEEKRLQHQELKKREDMYRQVLEIDAEDTLANFGLGSIEVDRENWKSAQVYLEKVIQYDPLYSVAYLSLGKAYKGLGLKDLARATWQKGLEVAARKGDLMPANQMQRELTQL